MNRSYEWLVEHSLTIVLVGTAVRRGSNEVLSSSWPRWSVMQRFEYRDKEYVLYYKNLWGYSRDHAFRRALAKTVIDMTEGRIH